MPLGRSSPARPRASPRRDVPFPLRGARGSLISYVLLFSSCHLVWCVPSTPRARTLSDLRTVSRQDPHTRCTRTQTCTSACCRAAVLLPAAVHAPKSPAAVHAAPQLCTPSLVLQLCTLQSVTHSRVSSRRLFRGLSLEAACTHCYLFRHDPVSPLRPLRLM